MTAKAALRNLFARPFVPLFLLLLSLSSVHPFAAFGQTAQTVPLTTSTVPLTGIIQPGDGNFYSVYQGDPDSCYGYLRSKCGWIEEVLSGSHNAYNPHYFISPKNGGTEGNFPGNLLEGPEGYLFGTNGYGGSSAGTNGCSQNVEGCGTFFEFFFDSSIERGSHGYESVNVLHNFSYSEDGQGGLITLGSDGNYYGVTVAAYRGFYGAPYSIYRLTPGGTFTELVNFANLNQQVYGTIPNQLVEGDDGYFYGTTIGDTSGMFPYGAVFRMDTSGSLTVIANFPSDGSMGGPPVGQLVEGPDGAFYGVTGVEGIHTTVFRVTKSGALTVLHTFKASEGMTPWGGLLLGSDQVLYGTMAAGGNTSICTTFGGCGTLFSINTDGSNFQVLHVFAGGSDGAHPNALIQDSNTSSGTIYGVTGNDGVASSPGSVIFQTTLPAGHQAAPVQIALFKKSDMSPITESSQIDPNTPLVLKWHVLNAFSNTMQQCYAHAYVQGDDNLQSGEDDWTGKQIGTADSTGYSGQAVVAPQKSAGYSLTCGGVESASFFVHVQESLAITTASLPNGTVGQNYSQTLAASGGTAPYTWFVTSGTLPPGLILEGPNGVLSGKPRQFGNYSFTIQAQDSSATPEVVTAQLTMIVKNGLAINPTSLRQAVINKSYSQTVNVTGGLPPYTETIGAGALPAGLTFNPANGTIAGTPTKLGTFNFTFSVADSENPQGTATQAYTLTVASSLLTIDAAVLPAAGAGAAFSQQFAATGGVPPYIWTVTSGTLPKGLLLSSTGMLSGTPQQYGPGSPFVVQASDSATPAQTANATFTLPVKNTLKITTPVTLPAATFGVPYSYQALATGGIPQYTWTAGGGLSNLGLSFDASNGIFHGTPTVTGTYTGGLVVTDSEGKPASDSEDVFITINPPAGAALSSTSLTASSTTAGVGQSVTFTAKVNVAAGTPLGIITFAADGKTLGTASLTNGVATLTTSFSAVGVYNVIASYPGDEADQASGSKPVAVTVVTPSVTGSISPSSMTIKSGKSGTMTITVTPTGGYTGTVSFSCGALPAHVSCTFVPPSLTIAAGSGPITDVLTVNTAAATESARLSSPLHRGRPSEGFPAMVLWMPGSLAALIGIFPRKRKRPFARRLWMLGLIFLALGGSAALSGCGGMSNDARPGTYQVPITLTLASGTPQTVNATVIVQ